MMRMTKMMIESHREQGERAVKVEKRENDSERERGRGREGGRKESGA